MRKPLLTYLFFTLLLLYPLRAETFGLGLTSDLYSTVQGTVDGTEEVLLSTYSHSKMKVPFALDFYGDIQLSKSKSAVKNLLSDLAIALNYRISLGVTPIFIDGNYNFGEVFDTQALYLSPELAGTLLYNIYSIDGYFIDAGFGAAYAFQASLLSNTDSYNGNQATYQLKNNFYFSYEAGMGKSFKTWAIRLSYKVNLKEETYKVNNSVGDTLTQSTITNPKAINLSLIFWW